MNVIFTVLAAIAVSGCATHKGTLVSTNPDLLVIGQKPQGYPKTRIEPYPDFPGLCLEVKESWREDSYQGQAIWLKDEELKSMRCPR